MAKHRANDPLDHPCPICKAGVDQPCRALDFRGLPTPHEERERPDGGTPLYDAVAGPLNRLADWSAEASPPRVWVAAEVPPEDTICGAAASRCVCVKAPGHVEAGDDVHACVPGECGGSWRGSEDADDFAPVTFPNPLGGEGLDLDAAALLAGALGYSPTLTVPRGGIRYGEEDDRG